MPRIHTLYAYRARKGGQKVHIAVLILFIKPNQGNSVAWHSEGQ